MAYKWIYRCVHWEFWPKNLVYLPVYARYIYDSIRLGSPFYFSTVNPEIEAGGLFGASKARQLQKLPSKHVPEFMLMKQGTSKAHALQCINEKKWLYPLIVKPDKGDRGRGIWLAKDEQGFLQAVDAQHGDFLIQVFAAEPFEAGVFVKRLPGKEPEVCSITVKKFLSIQGDGRSSVAQLLRSDMRARMAGSTKIQEWHNTYVPKASEIVRVQEIGNHNRGTVFLDGRNLWTPELEAESIRLTSYLGVFHYGRLDLRCPSVGDFQKGLHWKVLEVNGVNAEPAHIYEPGFSLLKGWQTLLHYWRDIAVLSQQQMQNGIKPMTAREALLFYRDSRKL